MPTNSHPPTTWSLEHHGYARTAVLLPGWATDARIFDCLALPYNLIRPSGLITRDIDSLADFLFSLGIGPVVLLGWSLGGFAAMNFARRFPDLVAQQVLVGIRQQYPVQQLGDIEVSIQEGDRARALSAFYRQCFLPAQREDFRWFRAELEPDYLRTLREDELLDGLESLAEGEVISDMLTCCPTTIIHGAQDIIAPPAEARAIAERTGTPFHLLTHSGHAAMLAEGFVSLFT